MESIPITKMPYKETYIPELSGNEATSRCGFVLNSVVEVRNTCHFNGCPFFGDCEILGAVTIEVAFYMCCAEKYNES